MAGRIDRKLQCAAHKAFMEERFLELRVAERKLLGELLEHAPPLEQWPWWASEMLLSRHLRYNDRKQLTLFILINRIPPVKYAEWLQVRKVLKDDNARNHVASLIHEHKTGAIEAKGYTSVCVDRTLENGDPHPTKRTVVKTPYEFALSEPHHWDAAIRMLKTGSIKPIIIPPEWNWVIAAKNEVKFQFPAAPWKSRELTIEERVKALQEQRPDLFPVQVHKDFKGKRTYAVYDGITYANSDTDDPGDEFMPYLG